MKNKILILILVIVAIISSIFIYINLSLKPLPEDKRNISTSNVKMLVNMEDVDNRTPIVRTYKKEEFDDFNENEIKKNKEIVNGNIEGDIPSLRIENGIGIFKVYFEEENKKGILTKIIPDDIPQIKISASSYSSQKEPKTIKDSFMKSEGEEGVYLYKIKRYFNEFTEDEKSIYKDDEFFMEFMDIEIDYEINNQKYVSILSMHSVEDKK